MTLSLEDVFFDGIKQKQRMLKYVCTNCGKIEVSGGKLEIHMRKHTGEQPFKCSVCPKTFANKSNRTKHEKLVHASVLD